MRSVSIRSFSMSIFRMSQLRTISADASAGIIPIRPCTSASAFSISRYLAVRLSSDQMLRIASLLKMFPNMRESTIVALIAGPPPCLFKRGSMGRLGDFLLRVLVANWVEASLAIDLSEQPLPDPIAHLGVHFHESFLPFALLLWRKLDNFRAAAFPDGHKRIRVVLFG